MHACVFVTCNSKTQIDQTINFRGKLYVFGYVHMLAYFFMLLPQIPKILTKIEKVVQKSILNNFFTHTKKKQK